MTRLAKIRAASTTTVLALAATGFAAAPATAAPMSYTASTAAELVNVIGLANLNLGQDTITIIGAGFTLTQDLPSVTEDLTVVGPGSGDLLINANGYRAFYLDTAGTVSISGLTLSDDKTTSFTGIASIDSTLGLHDVNVTGFDLGVQSSGGSVTITDSTFDDNVNEGMDLDLPDQTVSTIDGVTTTNNGNPGLITPLSGNAQLTVRNSTSTGNAAGFVVIASGSSMVSFSSVSADQNIYEGFYVGTNETAKVNYSNVTATNNDDHGIAVSSYDASSVIFSGPVATDNDNDGINIEARNQSTVAMTNATTTNNDNDGLQADADDSAVVTLTSATATDNGADGLDLYADNGGTITVTGAKVTGSDDNGLEVDSHNTDSTVTITGAVVTGSVSGAGADLEASEGGVIAISASTIAANADSGVAISGDGADASESTVTITDTTIHGNGELGTNSGGLDIRQPGGMSVVLSNSTISSNSGSDGGGISASLTEENTLDLSIVNSTISGNTGESVGGIYIDGSVSPDSHFALLNSTVVQNVADPDRQAGLSIFGDFPTEIRNTILAGNTSGGATENDLDLPDATAPIIAYSLIQKPSANASAFVDAGTGNLKNLPAKLGPLADNGGQTLTHLLLDDSPALDAGDPAFTGLTLDQRHLKRVVMTLDMGAVEIQQAALAATGTDAALPLAGGAILLLGLGSLLMLRRRRTAR